MAPIGQVIRRAGLKQRDKVPYLPRGSQAGVRVERVDRLERLDLFKIRTSDCTSLIACNVIIATGL